MRFSTAVLPLLPALALAAPQLAGRAVPDCNNPNGDLDAAYCGLSGEGLNTQAALYLASEFQQPDLATAIAALETGAAGAALISSLVAQAAQGTNLPTGLGVAFISGFQGLATQLPSGSVRDAVSSVFAQGLALQAGATPTAAVGGSGSASGSPSASVTAKGSSTPGSSSGAGASGSTSTNPTASVSKAGADSALPTGFGFAAAAIAAVAGLAVGL